MNTLLQKESHGGDFYHWRKTAGIAPETILDFSVNVRPDGMPDFLKAGILRTVNTLSAYPTPHAEELQELCAQIYGLKPQNFVFGNGSNELFLALAHALKEKNIQRAYIFEPAFSEYRFSLEKAGIPTESIYCTPPSPILQDGIYNLNAPYISEERERILSQMETSLQTVLPGSAVFLANPANPSGFLIPQPRLLRLIASRKDCLFIIDEAFIDYTEEKSLLFGLPQNAAAIRSLTKFYAIAGLRLGYLGCSQDLAKAVQAKLPTWNVNSFAIAAGKAVFEQPALAGQDAEKAKTENNARKADLYQKLSQIQGITLYASWANYVLFSLKNIPQNFWEKLMTDCGISVRNCANYKGLPQNGKEAFFRAAVRFPNEHSLLCRAMASLLPDNKATEHGNTAKRKPKPALMLLGTSSNAGKSVLTAAFCRIFTQDGYTVRPFKAQNMSLNSGVTLQGDEMGRAQIVQAKACRTEPDSRMNPILLKPQTDTGSQIIVRGKAIGTAHAREYYGKKSELWQEVTKAYDELSEEADIMVLEGAGSPAEINLKDNDIVNLKMAEYAHAAVLLTGDIDRGGIYASFLGTWQTFGPAEAKLLHGFLVNRFRGDSSLLGPAHTWLENITGKKVLGVIPYIHDIHLPEEDMAGALWNRQAPQAEQINYADKNRKLDIAVIMHDKISNHTDFEPLALETHCLVRPVYSVRELGTPDLIILPGSKSVAADLKKMQENGLADKIRQLSPTAFILGICGGLQMLGSKILDPDCIETDKPATDGMGLLPLTTEFQKEKHLTLAKNIQTPLAAETYGYEIHHGQSVEERPGATDAYFKNGAGEICGYTKGNIWATYIHGLFDDDTFRLQFINHVRTFRQLNPVSSCSPYALDASLDKLADIVRKSVDMDAVYAGMGIKPKNSASKP